MVQSLPPRSAGCYATTSQFVRELPDDRRLVDPQIACLLPRPINWMNSPSSGQHTAHYSPVIIAPFVAWGRRGSLPLFFWSGGREAANYQIQSREQYCPVNLELLVRKPIAARLSG